MTPLVRIRTKHSGGVGVKKILRSKFGRAVNLDPLLGSSRRWLLLVALASPALIAALSIQGCEESKPTPATTGSPAGGARSARTTPTPPPAPADALELVFPYGSEKKLWLEDVTKRFNESQQTTDSGKPIVVKLLAMGSGETVEEPLSERLKAHLISPASGAFIKLANARSQASTGGPLIESTQDLVLSPVVIAMWKPMAEALGWPNKPIGWSEIINLTKSEQGWASYGFPQWGRFKFGHTHPEYSNSGLMAVIAQAYAGAHKVNDLTVADVKSQPVTDLMSDVQRGIVHYGESTGFFGRKMFSSGPEFLSAAVLYESVVIESADTTKYTLPFPVVAIYPKEGTFWTEHPVGIINRPWVTPEHKDAAKKYIAYLLAREQQQAAMSFGFRPSDVSIPLGEPFTLANGVNPAEPKTTLQTPSAEVINTVIEAWRLHKKKSHVVLVMDTSGSMRKDQRIQNARAGAQQLIEMLGDDDSFSFLTFSNRQVWLAEEVRLKDDRAKLSQQAGSLMADGGTALFDSVSSAFTHLQQRQKADRIAAIVVLTDGEDTDSRKSITQLLEDVRSDEERRSIRIFTIGYGNEANFKQLEEIAKVTQAKFYKGTPQNIRTVFKEIATFF